MSTNSSTLSRRHPLSNALFRVCLMLPFALVLYSCSTYQNVTGYFNTYYNANKIFEEAVAEVERAPQKDRDTNYFAAPAVPPATVAKFDKVIEKCSKLIQFYPQSSWVEDGLLMIAKSYVYQREYDPAFRKFKELIDNFPAGDNRFEAKLWYARSKYAAKIQDEALALAKELFPEARAEGKDEIMLEALMLEAQIYFDRREFDQAAATFMLAVEVDGDDGKRAWSQHQLALCYEKLGESGKAADAYLRVMEFGPDFALEFRSRLRHGMMLSAVGKHQEAIAYFEDLLQEQLKPDEYGLTDLEIANAYWDLGDSAEAFSLYSFIDTTYRRSDAAARAHFRRGVIFEEHYADFRRALESYAKAKAENTTSEIAPLAASKSQNFNAYFATTRSLRNYDSLLSRALLPDSVLARMDSIARAADSTRAAKLRAAADSARSDESDDGELAADEERPKQPPPEGAARVDPTVRPDRQPIRSPEPSDRFASERPTGGKDDMRSRRAHIGDTGDEDEEAPFAQAAAGQSDSTKKRAPAVKAPAAAKLTPDTLRTLISRSSFELATLFFLEMGYPDSALFWYERSVSTDPASRHVPRTLYAMAEVYRTRGDTAKVDSLYRRILRDHAGSEYAGQVERVLGIAPKVPDVDPALESYAEAESLLQAGRTDDAVAMLKGIAGDGSSGLVPKATYSVGWIYENILQQTDSAAAWYRQLLADYPSSVYALDARPRVAVKDDPASLDKYVRVKRIEPVAKPPKPTFGRRAVPTDRSRRPEEGDDPSLRDADQDPDEDGENADEEPAEPDDEEAADPDDDGEL